MCCISKKVTLEISKIIMRISLFSVFKVLWWPFHCCYCCCRFLIDFAEWLLRWTKRDVCVCYEHLSTDHRTHFECRLSFGTWPIFDISFIPLNWAVSRFLSFVLLFFVIFISSSTTILNTMIKMLDSIEQRKWPKWFWDKKKTEREKKNDVKEEKNGGINT